MFSVQPYLCSSSSYPVVMVLGALDLVVVDRDPRHMRPAGGRNGPHRAANAAADVQGFGPRFQPKDARQPRLMCRLGRSPASVATP